MGVRVDIIRGWLRYARQCLALSWRQSTSLAISSIKLRDTESESKKQTSWRDNVNGRVQILERALEGKHRSMAGLGHWKTHEKEMSMHMTLTTGDEIYRSELLLLKGERKGGKRDDRSRSVNSEFGTPLPARDPFDKGPTLMSQSHQKVY